MDLKQEELDVAFISGTVFAMKAIFDIMDAMYSEPGSEAWKGMSEIRSLGYPAFKNMLLRTMQDLQIDRFGSDRYQSAAGIAINEALGKRRQRGPVQ